MSRVVALALAISVVAVLGHVSTKAIAGAAYAAANAGGGDAY